MGLTTDPNDPRLKRGVDPGPVPQNEVYLVLSQEERDKGFVRPYRTTYQHLGEKIERDPEGRIIGRLILIDEPEYPADDCYTKEKGYGGYILYPASKHPLLGKYITQTQVKAIVARNTHFGGCGGVTSMGRAIAETYARDPKFYGSTYCVHCSKHLSVVEFVWDGTDQVLGS